MNRELACLAMESGFGNYIERLGGVGNKVSVRVFKEYIMWNIYPYVEYSWVYYDTKEDVFKSNPLVKRIAEEVYNGNRI